MKKIIQIRIVLLLFPLIVISNCLKGEIRLPAILSDSMILQRNQPIPIWGWAEPGEKITVNFGGQSVETETEVSGKWLVNLKPLEANANPQTLSITGSEKIDLNGILIGEVWLLTGQSNMQWELQQANNGEEEVSKAHHSHIRLFNVSRGVAFKKHEGVLANWQECTPASARKFSAAGYFFGLDLHQNLNVPIGLINSSYGGSQVEAWMPEEYLLASDDFRPCVERTEIWEKERPAVQAKFEQDLKNWEEAVKQTEINGEKLPRKPRVPDALRDYRIASSIYNNMIAPLIPYAIKGAFWYQGESNEERAEQYGLLLPVFIKSWREKWGQGDFPFGIIQLPNFREVCETPMDEAWSHIREAQRRTVVNTVNSGLIVIIDIGEANDIHPRNKLDVGNRMSLWAREKVYGENIKGTPPMYVRSGVKDEKIEIWFEEVGTGLQTKDGGDLAEFAIAGADKKWYWAKAKIVGKDKIEVWSDKVLSPIAVRYAFNNNPANPNLTNETGLPASPFRTDDWADPTTGKR
ncbi:sialate O-acetylesterase [Flexithrix dorotheae]|uniref:sialate O-acetylesterase n=1 Tax=Flexithrix dorotheae TaxID=70993 RepID=UPI00035D9CA6|nr:sialate O-acetylesterase [Flexithrix dorotheae]